LRLSGAPFFIRKFIQRRKVTIIFYHNPSPSRADRHFEALGCRYNFISLKDFTEARRAGQVGKLPPQSLIVTFDDGFTGNYELLPIFEKHGITPTIFVCSGIVGTNRHFWFEDSKKRPDHEHLKKVTNDERLGALKEIGFEEDKEFDIRQALSKDEIQEMKKIVDFQSHTMFHPILPRCAKERAGREIQGSKEDLANSLGIEAYALAYPNGDYSPGVIGLAKEAGYECGLTIDLGFNDQNTDPFRLKRIYIEDDMDTSVLIVAASGILGLVMRTLTSPSYGYVADNW
jgi:peptidoglycan/xylan/chitin deacetylase (PgdA/CDA1 family)